jgi:polyphenol oxidase
VSFRVVEEVPGGAGVPLRVLPEWADRFPWLVQGITWRGDGEAFDLGISGAQPVGAALARWRALREALGMRAIVHARQVHGAEVWVHDGGCAPGLVLMDGVDGHLTDRAGLLLAVSVADCVPVLVVDPGRRAVAALHAGWRGAAAGILEAGVRRMAAAYASVPDDLEVHLGPAICGACYEVGPEVHAALRPHRSPPPAPCPVDVRAVLAERAATLGVPAAQVTVSAHCTRCGDGFFSHRGGSPARQMGVVGIRGSGLSVS